MDGSCGSFIFIRMDGNEALGEIFFFQPTFPRYFPLRTEKVPFSGLGHALFGAISLANLV